MEECAVGTHCADGVAIKSGAAATKWSTKTTAPAPSKPPAASGNGNGNNWLELNDSGGSQHQTLGIERTITTQRGANYTLNFDVAGRMGYDSDVTKIAVYVDGVKLASLSPQSGNLALAWNNVSYSFTGNGSNQTIRIVTEATERIYAGRGTMLDDIQLTETLNLGLGTEDSPIRLPNISASLNV